MRPRGRIAIVISMSDMTRAMQVTAPGKRLELVERDVPTPGRGEVLVRVEACGVCHSDSLTVEGHMPGIEYPRVPGRTRSPAGSRPSATTRSRGRWASGSGSAGSAATAATATRAAVAT